MILSRLRTLELEEPINMHIRVLFLLNGDISCFHKTHEVFIARQHRDNLIREDLASRFHGADVKIGMLEGGTPIRKEISKRAPIDVGDILASKLDADDEREMF